MCLLSIALVLLCDSTVHFSFSSEERERGESNQNAEHWMRWDGWENLSGPETLISIKVGILKSFLALEGCQFPFSF